MLGSLDWAGRITVLLSLACCWVGSGSLGLITSVRGSGDLWWRPWGFFQVCSDTQTPVGHGLCIFQQQINNPVGEANTDSVHWMEAPSWNLIII